MGNVDDVMETVTITDIELWVRLLAVTVAKNNH